MVNIMNMFLKKKSEKWKKGEKKNKERGIEIRSKLLKRGRHFTGRLIFLLTHSDTCEIYTCSIAIMINIYHYI